MIKKLIIALLIAFYTHAEETKINDTLFPISGEKQEEEGQKDQKGDEEILRTIQEDIRVLSDESHQVQSPPHMLSGKDSGQKQSASEPDVGEKLTMIQKFYALSSSVTADVPSLPSIEEVGEEKFIEALRFSASNEFLVKALGIYRQQLEAGVVKYFPDDPESHQTIIEMFLKDIRSELEQMRSFSQEQLVVYERIAAGRKDPFNSPVFDHYYRKNWPDDILPIEKMKEVSATTTPDP